MGNSGFSIVFRPGYHHPSLFSLFSFFAYWRGHFSVVSRHRHTLRVEIIGYKSLLDWCRAWRQGHSQSWEESSYSTGQLPPTRLKLDSPQLVRCCPTTAYFSRWLHEKSWLYAPEYVHGRFLFSVGFVRFKQPIFQRFYKTIPFVVRKVLLKNDYTPNTPQNNTYILNFSILILTTHYWSLLRVKIHFKNWSQV